MNTNTGAIYQLGDDLIESLPQPTFGADPVVLEELHRAEVERKQEELRRELTGMEVAALADLAAGDPVVPVSPRVVQQMELGRRELERRARRREQQRKGRGR